MTPSPRLAVILVNWNGKDVTLECLASLARISYPNLHVCVVDNGSRDGSVEAIRSSHPSVDILALSENRRFAGGNNAGIAHALAGGAEYILLLNNDTVVAPDTVTRMLNRFIGEERCGMVAPKIYYADPPDMVWFAGGEISFWTGTMRHTGIRETDHGQHDLVKEIGYATGCCLLTSRAVIERVGMMDEAYFMYGEDADWSIRVRRAGYRILYDPHARVWHKLSVSAGGHLSAFKLWNKFRSNFRFFARYASWYHWLTFPWLSLLVNTGAALRYAVTRHRPVS